MKVQLLDNMRPEELRVAFPYYRHDIAPRPILQNEAPRFSVLSIEADFSSKRPVSVFAWASREHQSKFEVWWLVVHGFGFQGLGLNGLGFPASSWLQGLRACRQSDDTEAGRFTNMVI